MTDFLMLILVGLALFLIGFAFKLYPPKKINPWAGFRTRLAMSSQVLWDEANRFASRLYIKIGLLSMALGAIFFVLGLAEYFWIVYAATIFFALVSIPYVDRHLKKFRKSIK
jgi:uncharacterized membrane protein